MKFVEYINKILINKTYHITCNCPLAPIDIVGKVRKVEKESSGEFLLTIERLSDGKMTTIGTNHPGLDITESN